MSLKPPADHRCGLRWVKSSHSNPDGAACVEIATTPGTIHIRDSKQTRGPRLAFAARQWAPFVSYAARH
ncbi:DUF397 domain-containing protein [Streptomyces tagetis]|uniref:DUF397 domain-containing protein n=1 Tax=Streptomyces tagetis TaxID=2820809 RepID=A0A941AZI5_9ACTN|nr:DUF397 domain-containing protein [Streptomyces sp. RG38]MBQ0825446.1 DUF397 domain-containing protein [Streptomyces sp. RG38]